MILAAMYNFDHCPVHASSSSDDKRQLQNLKSCDDDMQPQKLKLNILPSLSIENDVISLIGSWHKSDACFALVFFNCLQDLRSCATS